MLQCTDVLRIAFLHVILVIIINFAVVNNLKTKFRGLLCSYSFVCVRTQSVRCCLLVLCFKCRTLLNHAVHFWNINLTLVSPL